MGYEVWKLKCSNRKHGEMEYRGGGDYVCPVCGETYHDDEFDENEDDCESLSVYDAALIWASHGKDEDYTFGYSEEELEAALECFVKIVDSDIMMKNPDFGLGSFYARGCIGGAS